MCMHASMYLMASNVMSVIVMVWIDLCSCILHKARILPWCGQKRFIYRVSFEFLIIVGTLSCRFPVFSRVEMSANMHAVQTLCDNTVLCSVYIMGPTRKVGVLGTYHSLQSSRVNSVWCSTPRRGPEASCCSKLPPAGTELGSSAATFSGERRCDADDPGGTADHRVPRSASCDQGNNP